jgi:hypothetical protein
VKGKKTSLTVAKKNYAFGKNKIILILLTSINIILLLDDINTQPIKYTYIGSIVNVPVVGQITNRQPSF